MKVDFKNAKLLKELGFPQGYGVDIVYDANGNKVRAYHNNDEGEWYYIHYIDYVTNWLRSKNIHCGAHPVIFNEIKEIRYIPYVLWLDMTDEEYEHQLKTTDDGGPMKTSGYTEYYDAVNAAVYEGLNKLKQISK